MKEEKEREKEKERMGGRRKERYGTAEGEETVQGGPNLGPRYTK